MDEELEELCDDIEAEIVYIQNQDYGHPLVQKLLDLEAEIVLQAYYASQPDQITAGV